MSFNEDGSRRPPETPEESLANLLKLGKPNQVEALQYVVGNGFENGALRSDLTCSEHVSKFFEMARRMYVDNGQPKMTDAELGFHEGGCQSPVCRRLMEAYYDPLSSSSEDQSDEMKVFLDELEGTLLKGAAMEEMVGQRSGYFDSDTGELLPIAWATNVTVLGNAPDGGSTILKYTLPKRGSRVEIDQEGLAVCYLVFEDTGLMTRGDTVFQGFADRAGIEPSLFRDIIQANSPQL